MPKIEPFDIDSFVERESFFREKHLLSVECFVSPADPYNFFGSKGLTKVKMHVFNRESKAFRLYLDTLKHSQFVDGARALLLNCQCNIYNGQRQFVWADSTSVVLFCLQDDDNVRIPQSISSDVSSFEEEALFSPGDVQNVSIRL